MIKPLTSLRFFFAFFVFLSHLSLIKTSDPFFNWFQRNIFFEGYLGVSFFFILSGFILSYNYQDKFIAKKIKSKSFFIARIARIYPLHILTLLVTLPLTFINNNFEIETFIPNLLLVQSLIPFPNFYYSYNDPSWSISNEMFFYLIFPILCTFFVRKKIVLLFLLIVPILLIILISLINSDLHKTIFYVNPITRTADFTLGIILYQLYKNEKLKNFIQNNSNYFEISSIIIFAIFLALHNLVDRGYRFSVYYWLPMFMIILVFSYQKGVLSRLLSNPLFIILGEISFGFYMFHFIIIRYTIMLSTKFIFLNNSLNFIAFTFIVTLFISYLSFKWYEPLANKFINRNFQK